MKLPCCHDCGNLPPEYKVQDHVWLKAWPTYLEDKALRVQKYKNARGNERNKLFLVLCLNCLETRLGRLLELEDFVPGQVVNQPFFKGVQIGRRMLK
jgi:hypothetical protein